MESAIGFGKMQISPGGGIEFEAMTVGEFRQQVKEFEAMLALCSRHRQAAMWQIIEHGLATFSRAEMTEMLEEMGWSEVDGKRGRRVCMVPVRIRDQYPALSDRHWYEIERVHSDDERSSWAETATRSELEPHELRDSIAAGRVTRKEATRAKSGNGAGVATIQAVALGLQRWRHQRSQAKEIEEPAAIKAKVTELRQLIREIEDELP